MYTSIPFYTSTLVPIWEYKVQIIADIYNLFHGSVIFVHMYFLKESRNSQEFVENKP